MNLSLAILVAALAASPYAGQEQREIKALSQQQIEAYRLGKGFGMAKAAELNHYPGPKHVLELKEKLQLSPRQLAQTNAIWRQMNRDAVDIGGKILQAEAELEGKFRNGQINMKNLRQLTQKIARLNGKLRMTHLQAHLRQRALLTTAQIQQYDSLRGYSQHSPGKPHDHMHIHK